MTLSILSALTWTTISCTTLPPEAIYPMTWPIASSLLKSVGHCRETFFERLNSESANEALYFSPIKRVEWKNFTDVRKKLKVTTKGKFKEMTVKRDILGILAAKS